MNILANLKGRQGIMCAMLHITLVFFTLLAMTFTPVASAQAPQQDTQKTEQSTPKQATELSRQEKAALRRAEAAYESALATRNQAERALEEAIKSQDSEAVDAAKEAYDLAVKELSDAAMQQAAALSADSNASQNAQKKTRLFPARIDDLRALLKKMGDKLISWLTSVPFLAQLIAIISAILISPILAAILKKRVPDLKRVPESGFLLLPRKYIFQLRDLLRLIVLMALSGCGLEQF